MPKENPPRPATLGSNHRRVVSIRMRLLEESSLHLLDLFRGVDSIFTTRRALPKHQAEKMDTGIGELRSIMAQMKSELDLEASDENAAREAAALVAAMTTSIEELHPHYLKGYGPVPGPAADFLEARLGDLLRAMKKIKQALDQPSVD